MDNKNLIVAVVLSILILVGFQYFYVKPHQEAYRQQVLAEKAEQQSANPSAVSPLSSESALMRNRADIVKESPRVAIHTPQLEGSVNLLGARLDDLSLVQYRQTIADQSPNVILLSPGGSAAPDNTYYADIGWLGDKGVAVPDDKTLWKTTDKELTIGHPLVLTWDNGQGLVFQRTIAVDENFMFAVGDRVTNKTAADVTLYPTGIVARQGNPVTRSSTVLHEGPLGVIDGTLEEYKYKKLMESGRQVAQSKGGWLGITDKYWLVAIVPPQSDTVTTDFAYNKAGHADPNQGFFQTDFRSAPLKIAGNASIDRTTLVFAGAKRVQLLDQYAQQYKIPHFDRAIDFGWFYFLTKPFLYLLEDLGRWLGSFGLAILLFTVMLKIVTLPLSLKSYHSMSRMKRLQPEMKRIQERFADDKARQSQEMMQLYKREKVSPVSGCLPTLIQIPIFFALYKVLYVGIELRQVPFYGWIRDMSVADPTNIFTLCGIIPWTPPTMLNLGVWPIFMGMSMFAQQRLSPQPPDKAQANMFMLMPVVFTFMLAQMPAGLVIYWTWSNLLSICQQWLIMFQDAHRKGKIPVD